MKKLAYLLMAVSLIVGLLTLAAFAHTEDDPFVTDLIAGQHTDVGDVKVWNDGEYLYIQFVLTEDGWCLAETHLAASDILAEIPQTKKGNPIPGQFYWADQYALEPCITAPDPYMISLAEEEWVCDDTLYIAAHAVVVDPTSAGDPYADEVVAFTRVDGIEYNTSGDNDDNGIDLLGPPSIVATCVIESGDPSGCWTNPGYIPGEWTGTTFIPDEWNDLDDAYCLQDPLDQYRCPQAGDLTVRFTDNVCQFASDPNEPSLFVWEVGGKTEGFLVEALEDGAVIASYESPAREEYNEAIPIYFNVTSGPFTSVLTSGTFTSLRLTPTDNGGGDPVAQDTSGPDFDAVECTNLAYQEETAWGDGFDFQGANWAMYFTYTVQ